ncbi:UDP-N-acetylmuramoyl-tripeptide--D-alanyl-D-alanine ligase [Gorillibacterium sp. sgz5001074]|uniref:UDP-N-acetylmuramoyl-tripeptide--D-alanyl-D- alanine ligase n=1 Tax=Gorillibacterium sp. sgz5001074 TaxID=3446695 RepID=UPI003F665286
MNHILALLAGLAGLLYAWDRLRRSVHMLQLNSYRNNRFYNWNKQNAAKVWAPREWIPFAFLIPLIFGAEEAALLVLTAVYAGLWLFRSKEKEKKKLVYTNRVKRLFATLGLFVLAVTSIAVASAWNGAESVLLLSVLVTLLPMGFVLAANTINAPIEQGINNGYLNDARRIIRSMNGLTVIGITGSYGKTSVKHFLNTVLSQHYNTLMTPESFNTPMGVTRTVREQMRPTHEIFIAEMGAKQTGDIKELCDLAQPKYGILTSIGPQHLESFKTLENVQKTKYELPESLPEDGIAFLNADDANVMSYRPHLRCRKVTFGMNHPEADYRATEVKVSSKGTSFTVTTPKGEAVTVETALLGGHNVTNLLAVLAVGSELGVPLEKLAKSVKKIKPVQHRLELKRSGAVTIIDDSFNSNPVGSKAALEVLKQMEGKRILITPGMIELGAEEYELNKAFGRYAAESCDYVILVGKKQTVPIQDGLKEAGYPESQYTAVRTFQEAMQHLNQISEPGCIVLLENDLPDNYNE